MKRLFSFVALAGLLTACQLERIETAYSVDNAVATIEVNVIDVSTGVTPDVDITASEGTVSGTTVTITGNPSISEMDVEITVQYDQEYTETVHVNSLLAGGTATYSVNFLVGEMSASGYSITFTAEEFSAYEDEYEYMYPTDDAVNSEEYTINGVTVDAWYLNDSEAYLLVDVTYEVKTGSEAKEGTLEIYSGYEGYESVVQSVLDAYMVYTNTVETRLTISAYCYYNALVTYEQTHTDYSINLVTDNSSTTIGSFTLCTYSTSIQPVERAYSSGHYSHGHGNGYNAGGGIVVSE